VQVYYAQSVRYTGREEEEEEEEEEDRGPSRAGDSQRGGHPISFCSTWAPPAGGAGTGSTGMGAAAAASERRPGRPPLIA